MALASCQEAKSVVALSKSPVFHHQFSSITKAISGLAKEGRELKRVGKMFKQQWLECFLIGPRNYFQTGVVREHAPCLKGRQYRHKANNVIGGNKPLGIGYSLSSVSLADLASGWSVPFDVRRVKADEDEVARGCRTDQSDL